MPGREKARIWVAYARAFAQCLLEMEGHADHPAAHRLVRPMSLQGPLLLFIICCSTMTWPRLEENIPCAGTA